jgi:hypothetical protein
MSEELRVTEAGTRAEGHKVAGVEPDSHAAGAGAPRPRRSPAGPGHGLSARAAGAGPAI